MKTRKKQTTDQKTVEEEQQQTETPVDEEENVLSDKLNSLEMNKSKTETKKKKKKIEKTPKHEEESEKEEEQLHVLNQEDVDAEKEEEDDDDEEEAQRVEESDSSEDEVAPRNTIGDVPLVWYKDEEHIGYNIAGRKIKKQARKDKLDLLLAKTDDSKSWCKIYDEFNDEEVELTKEERKFIRRILKGKTPDETNPYQPYLDWFKWDDAKHPLSNAPEPKRRFIPSKWEKKKVDELVRAIRKGHIKMQKPKEESKLYLLWGDGSISIEMARHGLSYIPAPKPKLPGHEESYNPSVEYIPTQEEVNSYQLMYEEDRPKFIPKSFESLRSVPAYDNALKESFDRCLDLYLCPRTRKKRINIDPESLKPKLPNRKDLRPYPSTCYLEYRGHKSAIMSISVEVSGQWLASGSSDGTVRIWEVETGRCLRIWDVGEAVSYVAWNPVPELRILAVSLGHDVLLLNTGLGNEVEQEKIKELLHVEAPQAPADSGTPTANWLKYDKHEGIRLKHQKAVSSVEWHFKGDYFSTVMLSGDSRAILMHQLSKKHTQNILPKLHGLPVSSVFHPSRHIIFVATKKAIRVYDLVQRKLIRKLEPGVREVSSIAIHPAGDNLIVGSHEGKLCWFDMDLSTKPYRKLKCHSKDITDVAFHRSYPLFASCSDDSTAYVFHGMVYSDLNENPLIVPLEVLRGHKSTNGRGVMDCVFHPRQPWLFTAGADSVIKLYCN